MFIKKLLILGVVFGGLGVIIGAFGAHGLEGKIPAEEIETFETGVRYQFYHAFLALVVGLIPGISRVKATVIFYCLLGGILLFSGSIYGLATNAMTGFDFTQIALLTPLGGLLFVVAWGVLLAGLWQLKPRKKN